MLVTITKDCRVLGKDVKVGEQLDVPADLAAYLKAGGYADRTGSVKMSRKKGKKAPDHVD